jgi:pimeloyl-ACP methyl ester carboxylesterase
MTMPVLVACGAEDRLCPPELHARMAAECPTSQLSIIDGAGHLTPMEQPEALASVIAAWTAKYNLRTDNG